MQPVDGTGPVGEVRIKPEPDTFATLPYAPGVAAMLSDQVNPEGTPWDGYTRTFLKQAIAALAAEGYELLASFKPEFTLGRREGAELTPIDESLCYSASGFHLAHDYIIDLVAALNKQGLEVEHCITIPGLRASFALGARGSLAVESWRGRAACL